MISNSLKSFIFPLNTFAKFSCCTLLNFNIRNIGHYMKNVKRRVQLRFISSPTEQLWQGRLSAGAIQWQVAVFQSISFIESSHFTSGISISMTQLSLQMSPFKLLQPSQRKISICLVSNKAREAQVNWDFNFALKLIKLCSIIGSSKWTTLSKDSWIVVPVKVALYPKTSN